MLSRRQHAHLTAGSSSWPELRTRKPAAGAPGPCSVTSRALARSARCTAKPMSLRHRQAPPPQCAATKIARPSRSERSHARQGAARRAAGGARTGAAERVAQRDRAAVGVDALLVQAQLLDAVGRLPPQRPRSARAPGRRAAAQGTTRAAARGRRSQQPAKLHRQAATACMAGAATVCKVLLLPLLADALLVGSEDGLRSWAAKRARCTRESSWQATPVRPVRRRGATCAACLTLHPTPTLALQAGAPAAPARRTPR